MPTTLYVWQAYLLIWLCGSFFAVWPLAAFCCVLPLLYACKKLWTPLRLWISFFIFISAAMLVCFQLPAGQIQSLQTDKNFPVKGNFCAETVQMQGLPDRRIRLILTDLKPEKESVSPDLPGYCTLILEETNPFFAVTSGKQVCFSGTIRPRRLALNAEMEEIDPFWIKQWFWQARLNYHSSISVSGKSPFFAILREKFREKFLTALGFVPSESIPEKEWKSPLIQAKAILLALCFGDRRLLSTESWNNFASASLAHSLALSGQHLGIVIVLAILSVYAFTRLYPALFLHIPRHVATAILSVPLALLYIWIGNSPISLLRAAGMLFLAVCFICRRTIFTGLDLLAGTIVFLLLLNPLSIFDTGLQLSALCVALIIIFIPTIKRQEGSLPDLHNPFINNLAHQAIGIIVISLIIQLFLMPLNLLKFSQAGFYFPLNLLWLPILSIVVMPLAFLALLFSSMPGAFFAICASNVSDMAALPCQWLITLLSWLHSANYLTEPLFMRPHWIYLSVFAILVPILGCLLLYTKDLMLRRKLAIFLIFALCLSGVPPLLRLMETLKPALTLDVLDVGQGLSLLIKTPGNLRVLYDAGGSANPRFEPGKAIVTPVLTTNAKPALDAIINSHPDLDHLGGLLFILKKFDNVKLYHNGHEAHGSVYNTWNQLQQRHITNILYAGDAILLGGKEDGLRLEVLHPPAGRIPTDTGGKSPDYRFTGNEASLVLRLCKGNEGLALLTGDAEKETLEYIIKSGKDISAKVLIAPHHGSDRSLVSKFYRKVNPELVLVGCGFQNRWDYPGKKLRKLLASHNVPIMDTGNNGRIHVSFKEDGSFIVQDALSSASHKSISCLLEKLQIIIFGNGDKIL